jgi:hypothetical protein
VALRAVVDADAYEALNDVLKAEYTQAEDGNWYLDADDIDAHPKVRNLKSAFEKQKRDAQRLKEQADAFRDIDPDKYRALMDAANKKEEQSALDKGEFDKLRERLVQQHTRDLEKKEAELGKRDKFIHRILVDNELNAAIERAGVKQEYRAAVKALFREKNPEVIADGEDWRGMFKTDLGDVGIGEFVETWAKSDEATYYMPPTGNQGSGAASNAGGSKGATGGRQLAGDRNNPLWWGQNAEAIASGDAA